jgi:hypothetical protein
MRAHVFLPQADIAQCSRHVVSCQKRKHWMDNYTTFSQLGGLHGAQWSVIRLKRIIEDRLTTAEFAKL